MTLIGSSLLLLVAINSSRAAEIKIVSPSTYKDKEGEGQASNCCPPFRFQQVFPAEDFAVLGSQPHWIVAYTWRPDQTVTKPLTVQLPDQEVRLSTTQRAPNNLSLELDANFGSDVRQFYRGRVIPVADAHSGPGPRAFYRTEFPAGVTPFLYDPSQGNLLFDVISWQGETPARADLIPSMQTALYAEIPPATRGDRNEAAIFQFTFVPVQLIINGGFETPDTPTYLNIYPGQNAIAPWVAGLHSVEVVDAVSNGFAVVPAFEGAQFLDLNGAGRGRLTQAFATIPGLLYTLTFAYANNFHANPLTTASATVRLFDSLGDRLNQTITHTGSVAGNLHWTVFTAQFTALQKETSLEFTSLTDTEGYSGGILLDAVRVTLALRATLVSQGSSAILNWTGGIPPYSVQRATSLTLGDWTDVLTNAVPPVMLTQERQAEFYRILGNDD